MLSNSSMGVIRHERMLSVLIMVVAMHLGPVRDTFAQINPLNVGHINNDGYAEIVAVSVNYAYLANREDGLRIYDVSDPTNPINIGHTNVSGTGSRPWAFGVTVSSNYAYLANGDDGLRVFDISTPSNPVDIGHTNNNGFSFSVVVSGHY